MFADILLAARIDRAEGRQCAASATTLREAGVETLVTPVGGGVSVFLRPGSPMNKIIGAGFGEPIDEVVLAGIEAALAERGEPARVELSTLADGGAMLTARGYQLLGFENVLGLALGEAPPPSTIAVSVVAPDEIDAFRRVMVQGFANPDGPASATQSIDEAALAQVFDDTLATPGFVRYLARIDGEPAGGASLRCDDGIAQLAGAATLPGFRRRGVQAALFSRRLADARAAGCTLATVVTSPGTTSMANAVRQGFALLYARAVLIKGA
jgi:GNAT superfamily N-acetyltransferase